MQVDAAAKLAELRDGFRGQEKPPKASDKARLAELFDKVRPELLAISRLHLGQVVTTGDVGRSTAR